MLEWQWRVKGGEGQYQSGRPVRRICSSQGEGGEGLNHSSSRGDGGCRIQERLRSKGKAFLVREQCWQPPASLERETCSPGPYSSLISYHVPTQARAIGFGSSESKQGSARAMHFQGCMLRDFLVLQMKNT